MSEQLSTEAIAFYDALIADCVAEINGELARLGESPEAWRGAALVTNIVRTIVMGALDEREMTEREATDTERFLGLALTALVRAVHDHPMTARLRDE